MDGLAATSSTSLLCHRPHLQRCDILDIPRCPSDYVVASPDMSRVLRPALVLVIIAAHIG